MNDYWYNDYEYAILDAQESEVDDCSMCEYVEQCRSGERHGCYWDEFDYEITVQDLKEYMGLFD